MALAGQDFKKIQEALLSAFPTRALLERMVYFEIGERLSTIAGGQSLGEIVFELIAWAEASGRVDELVAKAYESNPGNPSLRAVVDIFRHPEDAGPSSEAEEWINRGVAQQSVRAYVEALTSFDRAVDLAHKEGGRGNEARALYLAGSLHREQGRTQEATAKFERALNVASISDDSDLRLELLKDLAGIYRASGNPKQALQLWEEVLLLTRKSGRQRDEANTLQTMAGLHSQIGEESSALLLLQDAVDLLGKWEDLAGQAIAVSELAATLLRIGDAASAEGKYQLALDLARQAQSPATQALALTSLGQLSFQRADYLAARALFEQALQLYEQISNQAGLLATLAQIGRTYHVQQNWDHAIAYYQRSLALAERMEDRLSVAAALNNIGTALREKGDLNEAESTLTMALELLHSLGDTAGILRTQEQLSLIRIQRDTGQQSVAALIADAQKFFRDAGFQLNTTGDLYSFLCEPSAQWKNRIPSPVFTTIATGQPLRGDRIRDVRDQAKEMNPALCYAFIVVDKPVDDTAWLQIAALRPEGFQAIPVPQSLLYEGRNTGQTGWERNTLLKHLTRFLGEGEDPFDVRDPVFDVLNFFGRETLADKFIERLGQGQAIGVFGLRKMGKSSLMRYIQNRIPYPAAWLQLQAQANLQSIYQRTLQAWNSDAQTRFDVSLGLDKAHLDPNDPGADFFAHTQNALAILAAKRPEARLALFLDEIDLIMPEKDADGPILERYLSLMRTLRGLVQEDRHVSLMVAGVDPTINRISRCGASNAQNPFFQLLQEEFLAPLRPEDCMQMVRNIGQQVEFTFGENTAEAIAEASGGHPALARQLCSFAYRQRDRQPGEMSLEELLAAAEEFLFNPQYASFLDDNGLWGEISNQRVWEETEVRVNKEILTHLAESVPPVPQAELVTGADAAIRRACLAGLYQLSLVHKTREAKPNVGIHFGLFRAWIRQAQLGLEA